MKKSKIFERILNSCIAKTSKEQSAEDFPVVSLDLFMTETLEYLSSYLAVGKDGDESDGDKAELLRTKEIFDCYGIDYSSAAKNIREYAATNDVDGSLGELQFINLTSIIDVLSDTDDNSNAVTLDYFIAEALDCPTDAIKEYILSKRSEEAKTSLQTDGDEEELEDEELDDDEDSDDEELTEEALGLADEKRELLDEDLDEEDSDEDTFEPKTTRKSFHEIAKELGLDFDDDEETVKRTPPPPPTLAEIAKRSKEVHEKLSSTVYGQDVAVNTFVSGYFQSELSAVTDKQRSRPRATFLFAGPPGVGKTYLSEQAAKALKLPFMRFDMSEYSDKEANIEFCGSDKVYKNAKEGNVTGFVAKHPKAVLLFDEVEKAHLNVIHLFLQILDAGRLRDNFTDEEVSFKDTIVIFTTNAGKQLYEDETINLATVTRKSVIKALSQDKNPVTDSPMFPAAICSRFAYGNVVMFNRMGANYLLKIAEKEIKRQIDGIREGTGIEITCDPLLPYAIIYGEGGVADARTVKGKSGAFIYNELYELFRLMQSNKNNYDISKVKYIDLKLELPEDSKIVSLFINNSKLSVLLFADGKSAEEFKNKVTDATVFIADSISSAEQILSEQEISAIIIDISCKIKDVDRKLLNVEDVQSAGRDFLYFAVERGRTPVYVLQNNDGDVSDEEYASLAAVGATGLISLSGEKDLNLAVANVCSVAYQQRNLKSLASANKVLSHKTLQSVSDDGERVTIGLFDFKLATALDAGDTGGVIDGLSKPKIKFSDVIGAGDAKEELSYFINYLKNAQKFIKRGVRAPKGILLYGPPGTGKTLLAKAMAGESDVTFITAEGNQFLKKYVGEGSESVHKLFSTARKYAPAILFIDEIDAIAKGRGGENNHSDDVLTSFLTEMDGFNTDIDRPVFVLAATNYNVEQGTSKSLDPALLRRFDRKIYVDLPNREERKEFIKLKLSKVRGNKITGEQIENLAVRSTGASLADLDSVFELAVRNVIKNDELALNDKILEEAFETYNSGDEKKWNEKELLRTARHEAGHALICYLGGETPSYLTIVARGSHGGYMQHADAEDKGTYTKRELLSRVRTALGGRAAEVVYYGDEEGISTGASGDLHTATALIENMICSYGMDETVGMGSVDLQKITSSPHFAQIVNRINEVLAREFAFVKRAIEDNRGAIDGLVAALMERNALKACEIEGILNNSVKR